MKIIVLFLLFISSAIAKPAQLSGPCSIKLLATGDREEDTTQFIHYLQLLLEDRTIEIKDLRLFLKSLELNSIINPIPNKDASKELAFHHDEFQVLIESKTLELQKIKTWVSSFVQKNSVTEKQKEKVERNTKQLPRYIGTDGAMFYLFHHPVLGEVYRILKPGGHYDNEQDWEPKVWAVHLLRDKNNDIIHESNEGRSYFSNKKIVSKGSPARKQCRKLGEGIDLPTAEDYMQLMGYFRGAGHYDPKAFHELFPESKFSSSWSSGISKDDANLGFMNERGYFPWHAWKQSRHSIRCVGTWRVSKPK